jgi:hypothetical protein
MVANLVNTGYCLVKDGIAYEGSKSTIVRKLCTFSIENGVLYLDPPKYSRGEKSKITEYHTDWTEEEVFNDAIQVLFRYLVYSRGYECYIKLKGRSM